MNQVKMNRNIILASQSPRRRELLTQAGFLYEVRPSKVEEVITKTRPWEVVMELSQQKAEDVYDNVVSCTQELSQIKDRAEGSCEAKGDSILVIGADTVVAYGNRILGKPHSEEDAFEMLQMLQGNTHQVYTGVTLVWKESGGKMCHTFHEETAVTLYPMTDEEIRRYIFTKDCMDNVGNTRSNTANAEPEWADKAGGYAIQGTIGAKFIKRIEGDYYNVVGLPIARLYQEMKELQLIKEDR